MSKNRHTNLKRYNIIYADPPWSFSEKLNVRTGGKEITDHYSTMSNQDIMDLPVAHFAEKNCVLFLWTTYAHLDVALQCMKAWGFQYKTVAFEWFKLTKTGKPVCHMGHYTCGGAIELCLLGRKGGLKRVARNVRKLIIRKVGRHSAKPSVTRKRIVQLYGDVPRIELFARKRTHGWDALGDQLNG